MDELHALAQALLVAHHRLLRDPDRGLLVDGLDDQRVAQGARHPHLAPDRKDAEVRGGNAVVAEDLLAERLVAREQDAEGIAAGEGHAQQLQVARHVGLVGPDVLELHQQVEDDLGLPALDQPADRLQVVGDAEHLHLVPHLAQRLRHGVLGLPRLDLLLAEPLRRVRWNQILVGQHDRSQTPHRKYSRCRIRSIRTV